jgi:hypothetical protein
MRIQLDEEHIAHKREHYGEQYVELKHGTKMPQSIAEDFYCI